jgi:hypothetical protein
LTKKKRSCLKLNWAKERRRRRRRRRRRENSHRKW